MNKSINLAERVRFGTFELNVRTGELVSIGTAAVEARSAKVLLRQQPSQILRILVERQGKIVTREEIRQILWPDDTVVEFDRSINVAMAILRKALADDADHPKYIETLTGRGYRLIAPVEWQPSQTAAQGLLEPRAETLPRIEGQISEREPRAPKHWGKAVVVAAFAVILIVVGYMSWRHFRDATPAGSKKVMLAVLPFENLTGDPNKEYLADGLTEETISQLGQLNPEQLGVIGRTSVMGYKHKDTRLNQIGRELSVQYVLENSLRENGNQLRLTAQLIQVKDQTHLWAKDYDYAAKDILNVEDDVAKSVAQEIRLRLTPQKQAELAQPHPVNPEAFEAYLQGYHFFQGNTDKDANMATRYFERATQLDPSYALAWAWLTRARNWQANQGLIPMEEGRRLAREAVERALSLNPNLAKAHIEMGRLKQQIDFDWVGADASFQRAISLEPGNPEGVRMAAWSAAMFGRFDEAVHLGRRAVDLDPLDEESWWSLGQIERLNGQLDQAAADGKKGLELDPDSGGVHILLSQIYLMQNRPQDALPEIERIHYASYRAWLYALAYHALGREKESDSALNELITKYHASNASEIAAGYAFRKQPDKAFEWLDRAYTQHDLNLNWTKVEPLLNSLHNDPRFAAFLKKLNLPN
jgi:TolB-like protein/DNA-binding winged helix-turn-helix (wHTH) protein/Tfp pilus assembly protein PilF